MGDVGEVAQEGRGVVVCDCGRNVFCRNVEA